MDILIAENDANDEPEYESPINSKWIVAVGVCGMVVVLKAPDIHFSFFDNGYQAESIGLPPDADCEAGIYEWICSPSYSRDWESGVVEFEGFDVISERLIQSEFD